MLLSGVGDDFSDSFGTAALLSVSSTGSTMQAGRIDAAGDLDFFRFTASFTGLLTVQQQAASGSNLDSMVTVFDGNQQQITQNDDDPLDSSTLDSRVHFVVQQGQTYYVQAAGFDGFSTGAYDLTFTPQLPTPITIAGDTLTTQAGDLAASGQSDLYQFTASYSGLLTVQQQADAANGSFLNSFLTVSDGSGKQLAQNDDEPNAVNFGDSRVHFTVQQGQTYYVQAAGFDGFSTGAYDLTFTPQLPTPITIAGDTLTTQAGDLAASGQSDLYQLTASYSGLLTVQQQADVDNGSFLDSYLTVYDGSGKQLVQNDDDPNGVNFGDSLVQLVVQQGQTYFVQAAASPFADPFFGDDTGAYNLVFTPEPFSTAPAIAVSAASPTTQLGALTFGGQIDAYQLTASANGFLIVQQQAASGSSLDSVLTVYDAQGNQIARNDDDTFGVHFGDSRVNLVVQQGQTYYVTAAASPNADPFFGDDVGAYNLLFTPDEAGDTPQTAQPVTVSLTTGLTLSGRTDVFADYDNYSFTAPITGTYTLSAQPDAGSLLVPFLNLFDGSGNYLGITTFTATGVVPGGQAQANLQAGQSYVVEVLPRFSSGSTGLGNYVLGIATPLQTATPLTVSADSQTIQSGTLATSGQVDFYQLTAAADGALFIQQQAASGSSLDSLLTVYDAQGNQIDQNDDDPNSFTFDSLLRLPVQQGQTYYVAAADFFSSGAYNLVFTPDDVGDTFDTALPLNVLATGATQSGHIDVNGDLDDYVFTAPLTGIYTISAQPAADSSLSPTLLVFDSNQQFLNSADSLLSIDLQAGQTYYLEVSGGFSFGSSASTGGYLLAIATPLLSLSAEGSVRRNGAIDFPGQTVTYSYTAAADGTLTLAEQADPANNPPFTDSFLDSFLQVYDDQGNLLVSNDNDPSRLTPDSLLNLPMQQGQTYTIVAGGVGFSTGAYVLLAQISPADDFGDSFDTAATLAVPGPGAAIDQLGTLSPRPAGDPADVDIFTFTALANGVVTVSPRTVADSGLTPVLQVFDGAHQLLGANGSGSDALDSLRFSVQAGQTYFLSVSGVGTGNYLLHVASIAPDDHPDFNPNDFSQAEALMLSPTGVATLDGQIGEPGDTDFFRATLTDTGNLTVTQVAAAGSSLDSFLQVYDANRNLLKTNDDAGQSLNSRLQVPVEANHTYYIRAAGFGPSTGAYNLVLTTDPAPFSFGTTFATATAEPLEPDGSADVLGNFPTPGQSGLLQFTATADGLFMVRPQSLPGSLLQAAIQVYDANRMPVGSSLATSAFDASASGAVVFPAHQGQTYYIQVTGSGSSTGAFRLTVQPFATQVLVPAADGSATAAGSIAHAGDDTVYRYVASTTGLLVVRQAAAASNLNSYLYAFDESGNLVASNDDDSTARTFTRDSRLLLPVQQGQSYYFRAAAFDGSIGAFTLSTVPFADQTVTLDPSNATTISGSIQKPGDHTVYQFTAPFSGPLVVSEQATASSNLDSVLTIFDSNGNQVAFNDDDPNADTVDSRVALQVVQGQTYYAQAAAFDDSTGDYNLIFQPLFTAAQPLTLAADGSGSQAGTIATAGAVGVYAFVAPFSGQLTIQQQATASSDLDSVLTIFDGSGNQIAFNDDDPGADTVDSRVQIPVQQGQTFYVQAGAFEGSTGAYTLTFMGIAGTVFPTAQDLPLAADGSATVSGTVASSGVFTVYRYVASFTGSVVVQEQAAGSSLDSYLFAYDARNQIAFNDDDPNADTLDSRVQFQVVQGLTYFLQAGAFGDSTGAFTLTVQPVTDDFGNTTDTAHSLDMTLASDGSGTQAGRIENAGDVDVFSFTAAFTGTLQIQQQAAGGNLDSVLTVFDADGNQLAFNDDDFASFSLDSRVTLSIVQGQTYYVQAAAYASSTGAYNLVFTPARDDFGNTLATAQSVTLTDGSGTQAGTIETAGDVDVFSFTSDFTGTLQIQQQADTTQNSFLDSFLTVFDDAGEQIAFNDNDSNSGTLDSRVRFDVQAGQTYYVQAAGFGGFSTGAYNLTFTQLLDDYGNTFGTASPIDFFFATDTLTQTGRIDTRNDMDFFTFTAPNDGFLVVQPQPGSELIPVLAAYDGNQVQLASNNFRPGADPTLRFAVQAGQTYYVGVSGAGDDTGDYDLDLSLDDFGDTLATAAAVALAPDNSGIQAGHISNNQDTDVFSFTAPFSGSLQVNELAQSVGPDGSPLDGYLFVYDAQGNLITFNDDFSNTDSLVRFDVTQGQTYFVRVGSFGNLNGGGNAGDYGLVFTPLPALPADTHSTLPTANPITVAVGLTQVAGSITSPGEVQVYRFTAEMTGAVIVRQDATGSNPITPFLFVFDAPGNIVASDYDPSDLLFPPGGQARTSSVVQFDVQAGQTYYVQAAAFRLPPNGSSLVNLAGDYNLTFVASAHPVPADDYGSSFLTASPFDFLNIQPSSLDGTIGSVGDADVFRFTAGRGGSATFRADGAATSALDPTLQLFDGAGNLLISDQDADATTRNSLLTANLTAGQTYFLRMVGAGASTGAYQLFASPGTANHATIDDANAITLNERSAGTVQDKIANPGDEGVFRFVADTTGSETATLRIPTDGLLQGAVQVYENEPDRLGSSTVLPIASGDALNSAVVDGRFTVTFQVTEGFTYYVRVSTAAGAASGHTTGTFRLSVGHTPPAVQTVTTEPEALGSTGGNDSAAVAQAIPGNGVVQGNLAANDSDVYQLSLTDSGRLTVTGLGTGIGLRLALLGPDGTTVLAQADGTAAAGPRLDLHLTGAPGGTFYYLRVQGLAGGTGAYTLDTAFQAASDPFAILTPAGSVNPRFTGIVTADFNDDGVLDMASSYQDASGGHVAVFLGLDDGSFRAGPVLDVGSNPVTLVTADFRGIGRTDLATINQDSQDVSVLFSNGDGTFQHELRVGVGLGVPTSLAIFDLNRDGLDDLLVTLQSTDSVVVLESLGNGLFRSPIVAAAGLSSTAVATGDLNGDGRPDVVTANANAGNLSVLQGAGKNQLDASSVNLSAAGVLVGLLIANLNGDSRPDVAVLQSGSGASLGSVSVLFGNGDGSLQAPSASFLVGANPTALLSDDFNGDGIPDLLTVNSGSNDLSILYGQGNGTFQSDTRVAVGALPTAVAVGDFNHDGLADLVVANSAATGGGLSILLRIGGGRFQGARLSFSVDAPSGTTNQPSDFGNQPLALAAADFNNDGTADAVTVNNGINGPTLSVLLGQGPGTLAAAQTLALPAGTPVAVAAGDFNGDNRLDVVVTYASGSVLLAGIGNGNFLSAVPFTGSLSAAAPIDFNGDRVPDEVTVNALTNSVTVRLGISGGGFQAGTSFPVGVNPVGIVTGDFNHDGITDLATVNADSRDVTILLGQGDGTFVSAADSVSSNPPLAPVFADLNGDGVADTLTLTRSGTVLVRLGDSTAPGSFTAPLVLNPSDPAQDVAAVRTAGGYLVAALDRTTAADGNSVVTIYNRLGTRVQQLEAGRLAVRLVAGDLNGDGRDDLVAVNAGDDSLTVFLAQADGTFARATLAVGGGPSDVRLANVDGDGKLDLLVSTRNAGQVAVLLNQGNGTFGAAQPYQASLGLVSADSATIQSAAGTDTVSLADLNGDGIPDLLVRDPGANDFAILRGLSGGAFAAPTPLRDPFGFQPLSSFDPRRTQVQVADVNGDGNNDLVVLDTQTARLSVFLQGAAGSYRLASGAGIDAGNQPSGFGVRDVNGDGKLDLVVDNQFGDVLVLPGTGTGTFQPFRRETGSKGQGGSLTITDLNGDGQPDFLFADAGLDRVVIQFGGSSDQAIATDSQGNTLDRQGGLIAPGATIVADVNGDGIPDLIVLNSGSNNILLFPGQADASHHFTGFAPEINGGRGFFTGTNPVSVAIADVNGDGVSDLVVADQGSNDLSVLFGQGTGAGYTLVPGPRLGTGGVGPIAVLVQDVYGPNGLPDEIPDIIVTNNGSNTVFLLPGVGGGLFNDVTPLHWDVGSRPVKSFISSFTTAGTLDLVTVNNGDSTLTLIPNFLVNQGAQTIPSGGTAPVDAVLVPDQNSFPTLVVLNSDHTLVRFVPANGTLTLHDSVRLPDSTSSVGVDSRGNVFVGVSGAGGSDGVLRVSFPSIVPINPPPLVNPGTGPTSGPFKSGGLASAFDFPNPPEDSSSSVSEGGSLSVGRPPSDAPVGSLDESSDSVTLIPVVDNIPEFFTVGVGVATFTPNALDPIANNAFLLTVTGNVSLLALPGGGVAAASFGSAGSTFGGQVSARFDTQSVTTGGGQAGGGLTGLFLAPLELGAAGGLGLEPSLVAGNDILAGVDLALRLLTGGKPVANLMPQKGGGHALVGVVVNDARGEEAAPAAPREVAGVPDFPIGLDDTLHRRRPVPPAAVPAANRAPESLSEQLTALDAVFRQPLRLPQEMAGVLAEGLDDPTPPADDPAWRALPLVLAVSLLGTGAVLSVRPPTDRSRASLRLPPPSA